MKLKIINIGKFIRTIVIVFGIVTFLLIIGFSNTYSKANVKYKEEYIISGDTLWSIAEKEVTYNLYFSGRDIRDVIHEIKEVNSIINGNLEVGQKILIPSI